MTDESVLAAGSLESLDEIRQLAVKYSLALDMRDMDAMVNCSRKTCGRQGQGRARLLQAVDG